jgi:hypothetical protein
MARPATVKMRECKGSISLGGAKIEYDSEKKTALVAGNVCDYRNTGDEISVDLHLLRDAIDVCLARLYPGAPKDAICPARLWLDTQLGTTNPVLVICGERIKDGETVPGIVMAGTRSVEE